MKNEEDQAITQCPFDNIISKCKDCALYEEKGCTFYTKTKNQNPSICINKWCPYAQMYCDGNCELFNTKEGCTFADLIRHIEEEGEIL